MNIMMLLLASVRYPPLFIKNYAFSPSPTYKDGLIKASGANPNTKSETSAEEHFNFPGKRCFILRLSPRK